MGWLSGYSHRIRFRIDHTKIDSDLIHFPVTLFLTEDNADAVFNELGSNYKKIAATSDDGTTQLYVEVEAWNSTNKRAVLHISRSSWTISSSADTYFYLYYDASAADNTAYVGDPGDSVAANVWDSYFAGVWHLSQDPVGGSGCIKDSTSNNNDGTPYGSMTSDDLVAGQVGKALDFDGSDDYVNVGNSTTLNLTETFTIEACINPCSLSEWEMVTCKWDDNLHEYHFALHNSKVSLYLNDGNEFETIGSSVLGVGSWYHTVGVVNTGDVKIYLNGFVDGSNSYTGSLVTTASYVGIGDKANTSYPYPFHGIIDEIRISNTARSDAWIKATYYSLFNKLVYTHEELTEWSYRKTITISGSAGAGTGYQVLLKVGESAGASGCDFHVEGHSAKFPSGTNDSGDLRFVSGDGTTFLNFWVEKVEGEAPNRVAYCWVKINDNLDSDVNIYCYYGNANASNVSNVVDTFIRVIDGVVGSWHFDEGSGTTAHDTSGNGNDGTLVNGPTWVDGKFGKALSFDGSNDYVDCGNDESLDITNTLTIEARVKVNDFVEVGGIVTYGESKETYALATRNPPNRFAFMSNWPDDWQQLFTQSTLNTGIWYHVIGVFDHGDAEIYVDGTLDNSATWSISTLPLSDDRWFSIGLNHLGGDEYFNGIIDEVRVYNKALNQDEISDLYNNYGYTTMSYPGKVLVRKYISPEPFFSVASSEEVVNGWYFSGTVFESLSTISGALIYLYKQEDGSFVGFTESDANGNFYIQTTYSGAHFMICRHPTNSEYNALVYDNLYPGK